jgi:hypothetical protein
MARCRSRSARRRFPCYDVEQTTAWEPQRFFAGAIDSDAGATSGQQLLRLREPALAVVCVTGCNQQSM